MSSPSLRTCVGCRRRDATSALARLALVEGRIVLWGRAQARPGGRGASVHPSVACVRAALASHGFARAFRGRVEIAQEDVSSLIAMIVK
jgi:uncharacterized protein